MAPVIETRDNLVVNQVVDERVDLVRDT